MAFWHWWTHNTLVGISRSALHRLCGAYLVHILIWPTGPKHLSIQPDRHPIFQSFVAFIKTRSHALTASYHMPRTSSIYWRNMQCCHLYAGDSQFHDSCQPEDTDLLHIRLLSCADNIIWRMSRHLQLNANKTETIWVRLNLCLMSSKAVQLGLFHPDQHVHDPVVIIYAVFARSISDKVMTLVLLFIMSRLDNCNLVLACLQ